MRIRRMHNLFLLCFLVLTVISCRKEEDTVAIVNVVNILNEPQPNIIVHMFGESSGNNTGEVQEIAIDLEQVTDENGKATFDFTEQYELGQAGFAVLNLEVLVGDTVYESIIKVEPEETVEETIIVQ